MNEYLDTGSATANFSMRRSSDHPTSADDIGVSAITRCGDLRGDGRISKYISVDAAKILFEEESDRIALFAIPFREASLARPRWTLEIIYDFGPRYVLQSRSRHSRPIFANTPSGVYGIAAEIGAEQVVLCMPKE